MQVKERRIFVNLDELKILINEIKEEKDLSLRKISAIIGTNIKNILYGITNSIIESSIIKLAELSNKRIKYKIIEEELFIPHLKKNILLAELVGIILGDGSLDSLKYRVQISFNGFDEIKYVSYVKNLLIMLFHILPKEYWEKNKKSATGKEKGMILYYHNKQIFNELISHGIIPGNKVKNQVTMPRWIKANKKYIIACIRGLFDTDGSLHLDLKRPSLRIEFSNASLPLIKDFYEMCLSLGIIPQPKVVKRKWKSVKNKKITFTFKVIITAKSQISKFLYLIEPKKWHFNSNEIAKHLNKIGFNIDDVLLYKNKFDDSYYSKEIIKQSKSQNKY